MKTNLILGILFFGAVIFVTLAIYADNKPSDLKGMMKDINASVSYTSLSVNGTASIETRTEYTQACNRYENYPCYGYWAIINGECVWFCMRYECEPDKVEYYNCTTGKQALWGICKDGKMVFSVEPERGC